MTAAAGTAMGGAMGATGAGSGDRIVRIEWGRLEGRRPRKAGCNARLGEHGTAVRVPLARITTADGSTGIGRAFGTREQAEALLGRRFGDVFSADKGADAALTPFDLALWDLAGRRAGQPVYALAARANGQPVPPGPFRVPCYDTSLYFDDLHLESETAAAHLIADEAREGYERGHRAFKIKVGRGARHLPLEEGTRRDIAVVKAVRAAVGPACPVMIDANNGYNLNLAKRVLAETAECRLFWIEEAFHEDPVLYRDLQEWKARQEIETLIADGEGLAAPPLLQWARDGVIDVVQYDTTGYGLSAWLAAGKLLDSWGRRSAPHNYGSHFGNYASGHLAAGITGFAFVEWDEAATPGIDGTAYAVREGLVTIPDAPGYGVDVDDATFRAAVQADGYAVTL